MRDPEKEVSVRGHPSEEFRLLGTHWVRDTLGAVLGDP